jgi:hypothetical protein
MKIIGCDLHARQQTIAIVDRETGELIEKTLSHEGDAVREFYAGPGSSSGGRDRGHGHDAKISRTARRTRHRVPSGPSGQDPCGRNPEAETRSTGCSPAAGLAGDEGSLSGDLDAVDGATRLLNLTAGPTPVGEDTSTIAAHLAGDRAQSRPASRPCALECCGAESATGVTSATLQQSETDGTAALVRTVTDANPGTG